MRVEAIHVEYGRTVGDGNYGSERLSAGMTVRLDPPLDPMVGDDREQQRSAVLALTNDLRFLVLGELKHSESEGVRLALESEEEREARWAQERAAREEGR